MENDHGPSGSGVLAGSGGELKLLRVGCSGPSSVASHEIRRPRFSPSECSSGLAQLPWRDGYPKRGDGAGARRSGVEARSSGTPRSARRRALRVRDLASWEIDAHAAAPSGEPPPPCALACGGFQHASAADSPPEWRMQSPPSRRGARRARRRGGHPPRPRGCAPWRCSWCSAVQGRPITGNKTARTTGTRHPPAPMRRVQLRFGAALRLLARATRSARTLRTLGVIVRR